MHLFFLETLLRQEQCDLNAAAIYTVIFMQWSFFFIDKFCYNCSYYLLLDDNSNTHKCPLFLRWFTWECRMPCRQWAPPAWGPASPWGSWRRRPRPTRAGRGRPQSTGGSGPVTHGRLSASLSNAFPTARALDYSGSCASFTLVKRNSLICYTAIMQSNNVLSEVRNDWYCELRVRPTFDIWLVNMAAKLRISS